MTVFQKGAPPVTQFNQGTNASAYTFWAGDGTWKGGLNLVNVKTFGAVGDGASHTLSTAYSTLAAAQAVYPFATALTQELDYCACKNGFNALDNNWFGGDCQVYTKHAIKAHVDLLERLLSFERQRVADLEAFAKCPIGLDASPDICSAGTCRHCLTGLRAELTAERKRREEAEAALLHIEGNLIQGTSGWEAYFAKYEGNLSLNAAERVRRVK